MPPLVPASAIKKPRSQAEVMGQAPLPENLSGNPLAAMLPEMFAPAPASQDAAQQALLQKVATPQGQTPTLAAQPPAPKPGIVKKLLTNFFEGMAAQSGVPQLDQAQQRIDTNNRAVDVQEQAQKRLQSQFEATQGMVTMQDPITGGLIQVPRDQWTTLARQYMMGQRQDRNREDTQNFLAGQQEDRQEFTADQNEENRFLREMLARNAEAGRNSRFRKGATGDANLDTLIGLAQGGVNLGTLKGIYGADNVSQAMEYMAGRGERIVPQAEQRKIQEQLDSVSRVRSTLAEARGLFDAQAEASFLDPSKYLYNIQARAQLRTLGPLMARMAGEVGAMTERDVKVPAGLLLPPAELATTLANPELAKKWLKLAEGFGDRMEQAIKEHLQKTPQQRTGGGATPAPDTKGGKEINYKIVNGKLVKE